MFAIILSVILIIAGIIAGALYAGEKEAEMNKRISESLTGELTNYYWIKQWNGELPSTVLSNDGNYMLALNNTEKTE